MASLYSVYSHVSNISDQILLNKASSIVYSTPVNVFISQVLGYLSIFCWICVSIPQLYENWKQKSSESVSLAFVLLWAVGDIFNFAGSLIQGLVLTAILLAGYYLLSDLLLVTQVFYYKVFYTQAIDEGSADTESTLLYKPQQNTIYGSDSSYLNDSSPSQDNTSIICSIWIAFKACFISLLFIIPLCIYLSNMTPQSSTPSPTSTESEGVWWGALFGVGLDFLILCC
ncbi:putative vacuolar membrane transporter for cationic amino acids [Entomophthora muscae]|uniref:Vacuolar membrane transporter for cationic amino acids n=1 Tax=Entomophthora muscae TaxID=34485 RepID=A0ACC2TKZ7_9FUNG|nr:putative vacuolar membrane transporter for cationic amino acids [Entomophthora muscae]